ncbi:MAG: type IV pilus modification protein PilV [Methylicorpusculum sp.]|uniref:type IV pilus modification protein PilV n=1 Tax=Methylicorpusculum sp. TaxID=2713644 RepID=UPI00271D50D4|nr:type IV pilus modification protein PilV [Methylicorpusculum sp.]MDO8940042.1 type IV pilus modification protein PilV [Methylicorpusculum sp.]MDP2203170.1 type IV pilus modification protein PilV [Methylicorpusculum sp.]
MIRKQHTHFMQKSGGFTLIEVMIAMVIMAVGLLGLAGLQATGLRNNQSAYNRSQATQLAYDMSDRIRANSINARNFATSVYATVTPPSSAAIKTACNAVAGTCTPADMAENDLFEWNRNLIATLPSGAGLIRVSGTVYTITVTWDDKREAAGVANNTADTSFQMSFQL